VNNVGIRSANSRLARLCGATTASERTAKATRSSLRAEISEIRPGGYGVVSALGKRSR
jgi:hypothetical protein